MENVSFTFEDAQRISDAVLANERSKYAVKPIDLTSQSDEFVIVYVSSGTKELDLTQTGRLSYWNDTTHLFVQYDPVQEVRVKAANTAETLLVGYVFARFQGSITRSGVLEPVYIAVGSYLGGGGSATITVVTGVGCSVEDGLEVTYATFSGADYDNAITRQFLSLQDVTPISFAGNQGRVVKVNDAATALEFGVLASGSPTYTTFIALSDTPATFAGSKGDAGKTLYVNTDGVSIGFVSARVTVTNSITGGGNPNTSFAGGGTDLGPLRLVNDTASPGNNKYYGTTSTGVRGWQSIQSLLDAIADLTARVTALEAP
jgi:hypothetical protein